MNFWGNSGVQFVRAEVRDVLPQYTLISDAVAGETAVKSMRETYLPDPSQGDDPTRYANYLLRALYYNFTRRTLQGLCGQAFATPPAIEVPAQLAPVVESASGDGVTLAQQIQATFEATLAFGRSGLLVDFPDTGGSGATARDVEEGAIRPTITRYESADIINWRTVDVGAEEVLTLLVLRETHEVEDPHDRFVLTTQTWYREIALRGGAVEVTLWAPGGPGGTAYSQVSTFIFRGADGQPLRRIPFFPVGAGSNRIAVEAPAFYDLAALNIAHYRNSADYEEMLFVVGQPTAAVSGLSEHWLTEVLGGTIRFGVRGGLPLPTGASVNLLQIEPNPALLEAMQAKERQAVALGAKLVESQDVQRTATESRIEATAEGSVLESVARNVSSAYTQALRLCADLLRAPYTDDSLRVEINTDFDVSKLGAQDVQQVIASWQTGAISWSEQRRVMRAVGYASQDDETARREIDDEQQAAALRLGDSDGDESDLG